jgi:hypothetical protein
MGQRRPCHSEPFGFAQDKLREESHKIKKLQILHGVYPELKIETLRFTQGDTAKGSG